MAEVSLENSKGVEVLLDDLENNPTCPHGPTLLFKRKIGGGEQKYFACAACRDRKDCNFFLKFGNKWNEKMQEKWDRKKHLLLPKIDHDALLARFQNVAQLPAEKRSYCQSCCLLFSPEEICNHSSHDITKGVTDHQLSHPSELLKPLESAKKEAQYLFAKRSTEVIVNMLRKAGTRNVLCVGAPRIHEHIRTAFSSDMSSMLLDFDHRYHQFYMKSEFSWFNVFNCHWLLEDLGKKATMQFISQQKSQELVIVTDPPFGGRVEPLAYTFKHLDRFHEEHHCNRQHSVRVMWIFPYFMEAKILESCSDMLMLDYKVDYDNHPLFQQGHKGRKYGSPVRIFTNISPSKLPLPEDEGYHFCDICNRWVSSENRHCYKCNSCTSKDGRTYIHCDKCARCVKPTWQHCKKCKRCHLVDDKCGDFQPFGCFACHKTGHKKNECPLRINVEQGSSANRIRFPKKQKYTDFMAMINDSKHEKGEDFSSLPSEAKTRKLHKRKKVQSNKTKKRGQRNIPNQP